MSDFGNKDKPAWETKKSTRSIEHCLCSWERFFKEVMSKEVYMETVRPNPVNKCTGVKTISAKQKKLKHIERLKDYNLFY